MFKTFSHQYFKVTLPVAGLIAAGPLSVAFADAATPGDITIHPVIGFSSLGQAISTLITAGIFFGALLALIFIVLGAFKYLTAGEDASGIKAARATITNAVVGLILLACVWIIFQIVIKAIPGLSPIFGGV